MRLPDCVQEDVLLASMTTFGVGGPARLLARPATREQVVEVLAIAAETGLPVLVLGGGSNLLVADAGIDAMVIVLSGDGEFGEISDRGDGRWRVGAAAGLQRLVKQSSEAGWAGMEHMAGIPGTVGGAAAMNAGSAQRGIGELIAGADCYAMDGTDRFLSASELEFSYRASGLAGLLAVSFDMVFSNSVFPDSLREAARVCRARKMASQPLGRPSAGCVFKNPRTASAGALLDAAGCKGMTEGGARVSDLHANFIILDGPARARDIAALAVRMREAVLSHSGIRLETEIALWGDEPLFAALSTKKGKEDVRHDG